MEALEQQGKFQWVFLGLERRTSRKAMFCLALLLAVETSRIAKLPKWLQIGLRNWQMTKNITRQRDYSNLLSNNDNFYYLKQIRCLPMQNFIIQTVVTQHHLIRRYDRVTFAVFELGPPVICQNSFLSLNPEKS